jgi:hypothetical protein
VTIFRARAIAVVAVLSICALSAQAQRGPGGAQFLRYPFDTWAGENAKPQIRWDVRINPARLSPHQRLVTQLHMAVNGGELQKRQNDGQIMFFVRIEDSDGHRYQIGNQSAIAKLRKGETFGQLTYNISAFILPGDYIVSLAVCDGKTLEHSFVRQRLHVADIKPEPLPNAWQGLPPVEFLPEGGAPYSWYLPQLRSVIRLPLDNERPVRVELLVNTTPSDLGSLSLFRANMQFVVPAMKVLMGIDPAPGSIGLSIVDLNRRILTYQQPDLHLVNVGRGDGGRGEWGKLRPAFSEFSSATVDAMTLAGQRKMLDYFMAEATRLLVPAAQPVAMPHALIVLSAPVYFTQQERPPLPDLPPDPARRVFYIRYAPFLPRMIQGQSYSFADDLEHLLKPMGARVFRVETPEQFRKALGAILAEIAKM